MCHLLTLCLRRHHQPPQTRLCKWEDHQDLRQELLLVVKPRAPRPARNHEKALQLPMVAPMVPLLEALNTLRIYPVRVVPMVPHLKVEGELCASIKE